MNLKSKFTPQSWPEHPELSTAEGKNKVVGFWIFLGGETVLFATLFATFLALKNKGPSGMEFTTQNLFELPLAFIMTMLLLTSSLTSVYAMYHMKNYNFKGMQAWLAITVLLGLGFLGLEIYEFTHYVHEGFTFSQSAFGSSFYTLVGTHGLHVVIGLAWIVLLMVRNAGRGLNLYNAPKYFIASLYWHFIDVVWVFIFTVVYLMGVIK
ncbi:cytochrome (ubi)quinol oxidase subunit III [Rummeliibacillus sp. G93]|uniref:Cytochrome B oxidoreductase n=1 Tax=Rummeliibacillus stabekisii TaxID=241244 RepID=A0A143HA31_9BACL|nr:MULTISPECIES: cytochrome (ubi)quinol oxidase subunit III [Rummeliibacillus]AMW98309.1 cytochrome B oxidoreductase [Rummeliibacillus stabekisii]MBB5170000.1 cytochrome c oxidase subunit 3 [Rummeliibacillus stabekisii]MCM3315696.1 cytochrome (ubi)quinol oxidase subunit III [Rummeliibacillus stabekisii]UQW98269.1 cytochrome (ubi)quinol oxidase subunit III [Rummeliibacillus sp. G93]GEL04258.1 cytochrome B oxidoreductase [Rummeliibacillus stabekisii]